MRSEVRIGRWWLLAFIAAACGGGVSLDPFAEPRAPDEPATPGEGGAGGEGGAPGEGGASPNGGSSDGGAAGSAE